MNTKTLNIAGYARNNEQFVVKTGSFDIRFNKNDNHPELHGPSPIEYVLAGLAGCIHSIGKVVAMELGIHLYSLQVNISGEMDVDRIKGEYTGERVGYQSIEVEVKPISDASDAELKKWLDTLQKRCPISDNLLNPTAVSIHLVRTLETAEVY